MNRREFLATGAALPIIEHVGILDHDGVLWTRVPGADAREACFYFYGKMQVSTSDLMRRSWADAEATLREEFERLVTDLHAFHVKVQSR